MKSDNNISESKGSDRKSLYSSSTVGGVIDGALNSTNGVMWTDMLRITVEDTGPGLSEEAMEKLFHHQAAKQGQRFTGGTGLGLFSLAKRTEALGGRCGVHARDDGKPGCVFWFAIPYRPDNSFESRDGHCSKHGDSAGQLLEPEAHPTWDLSGRVQGTKCIDADPVPIHDRDDKTATAATALPPSKIHNSVAANPTAAAVQVNTTARDPFPTIVGNLRRRSASSNPGNGASPLVQTFHETATANQSGTAGSYLGTMVHREGTMTNRARNATSQVAYQAGALPALPESTTPTTAGHTPAVCTAGGTFTSAAAQSTAALMNEPEEESSVTVGTVAKGIKSHGDRTIPVKALTALSSSSSKLRVLVVDDAQTVLRLVSRTLEKQGFIVDTAKNGAVALDKMIQTNIMNGNSLSEKSYDVVLTDIQMPVMSK
jgi:hypothetical protein